MIRLPPRSTRTDTRVPCTTPFRSPLAGPDGADEPGAPGAAPVGEIVAADVFGVRREVPCDDSGGMLGHGALPRSNPRLRGALKKRVAVEEPAENGNARIRRGNEQAQPPGDDLTHQAERLELIDGTRRDRTRVVAGKSV